MVATAQDEDVTRAWKVDDAEARGGRPLTRESGSQPSSSKDRRTAVSPFRSLPELHPHEVELRVAVKDLSREVAPEKYRSRVRGVGGFMFGLLVFPQGTKSAPEHAKKNRPSKDVDRDGKADKSSEANTSAENEKSSEAKDKEKKGSRWISAFVEARPTEDYPPYWYFEDVQFLVSLINFEDLKKSIVKHDKHTFSPVESSDGKAIDRGWHDFVHCDEATLRNNGFVDPKDDKVCFRASVYLAGGGMKVSPKTKSRYLSLTKVELTAPCEKVPNFLSSLVQLWYHIGSFRALMYNGGAGHAQLPAAETARQSTCVVGALREVFARLQCRSSPASCSTLCLAFGRRMWTRICELEPDAFCCEVFRALEMELNAAGGDAGKSEGSKGTPKKDAKAAKNKPAAKVDTALRDLKALWESVRELFEIEVEWAAHGIEGGDYSDSCITGGPVVSLVVRGFSTLEATLDHYFCPKVIEDGSGCRVRTTRRLRRLPMVLQWYLKRGDYDCCTGLCGLTDTYLAYPRQLDMSKYCEGAGVYLLYGVMVEADEHHWAFIRPEMEGDQGQWYRFDDRESVTAMSNASAIDASFGGEEWLCVNYLYGPSAVLKRPKESRACMLVYLKESSLGVLLHEPRPPKISRETQNHAVPGEVPAQAGEAEAAAAAAQALLEEVDAQAQKEERKRKQKQKKRQKEKEKRSQARHEGNHSDSAAEESKGKTSLSEGNNHDGQSLKPSSKTNGLTRAMQDLDLDAPAQTRESSSDSGGGFEENHRSRVRRRMRVSKPEPKPAAEESAQPVVRDASPPAQNQVAITERQQTARNAASEARSAAPPPHQAKASAAKAPSAATALATATTPAASAATTAPPPAAAAAAVPAPAAAPPVPAAMTSSNNHDAASPSKPPKAAAAATPASSSPPLATSSPPLSGASASAATGGVISSPPPAASANPPVATDRLGNLQKASPPKAVPPKRATAAPPASPGPAEMPEGSQRCAPASSSSCAAATGSGAAGDDSSKAAGLVFPEQVVTQDGALGEYEQFICKLCNMVLRAPAMLSCAHMFCGRCFNQWVQKKRPDVCCPSCGQAAKPQDVVYFEGHNGASRSAAALGLVYRLYSGMKVRCLYHEEMLGNPRNADAERAKALGLSCTWRGALHDYTAHLSSCEAHKRVVGQCLPCAAAAAAAPAPAPAPALPAPSTQAYSHSSNPARMPSQASTWPPPASTEAGAGAPELCSAAGAGGAAIADASSGGGGAGKATESARCILRAGRQTRRPRRDGCH